MKDSRSILLLIVSGLLIIVSCALLWTWGFKFDGFTKEKESLAITRIKKDTASSASFVRDSLQKIYSATINNFGMLDSTWNNADSLKNDLEIKLNEFYRLRNEIALILKNPVKPEDLALAKGKISELQRKVEQLRTVNLDVGEENKRLYAALAQLRNEGPGTLPQAGQSTIPAEPVSLKSTAPSAFAASELQLTAWMVDGSREQETFQALQTDKFVGSFTVRNPGTFSNSPEIIVVILQPDNKVLQTSAWESGRFDTRDGRKIYSCKVKFDYNRGESKRLSFSLNGDNFQKGIYIVQLYYNGSIIGKMSKTLG